jgi:hypothetical protein
MSFFHETPFYKNQAELSWFVRRLDYSMSQITQIVEAIMESFWAYSYQSQVLIALKLR